MQKVTDIEGKVAEYIENKKDGNVNTNISIIDEAKSLRNELEKLKEEVKQERIKIEVERNKMDQMHAEALLGGKSYLGNPIEKTKEDIAKETAREILKMYGK